MDSHEETSTESNQEPSSIVGSAIGSAIGSAVDSISAPLTKLEPEPVIETSTETTPETDSSSSSSELPKLQSATALPTPAPAGATRFGFKKPAASSFLKPPSRIPSTRTLNTAAAEGAVSSSLKKEENQERVSPPSSRPSSAGSESSAASDRPASFSFSAQESKSSSSFLAKPSSRIARKSVSRVPLKTSSTGSEVPETVERTKRSVSNGTAPSHGTKVMRPGIRSRSNMPTNSRVSTAVSSAARTKAKVSILNSHRTLRSSVRQKSLRDNSDREEKENVPETPCEPLVARKTRAVDNQNQSRTRSKSRTRTETRSRSQSRTGIRNQNQQNNSDEERGVGQDVEGDGGMNSMRSMADIINNHSHPSLDEELRMMLAFRCKAKKFNMRERIEEQMQYIKRLRLFARDTVEKRKALLDEVLAYSKVEHTKHALEEKEVGMARREAAKLKKQVEAQDREIEDLKQRLEASSEMRNRLLTDNKEMVSRQEDALEARFALEKEKAALSSTLKDQERELEGLRAELAGAKGELRVSQERAQNSDAVVEERLRELEASFATRLEEEGRQSAERVTQKDDALRRAENELAEARAALRLTEESGRREQEELVRSRLEAKGLESEALLAKKSLEMTQNEVKELRARLEKKEGEMLSVVQSVNAIHENARESSAKLEAEKASLQALLKATEEREKGLESRETRREMEISQLREKAVELEESRERAEAEAAQSAAQLETARAEMQEEIRQASVEKELRIMVEGQMKELRTEFTAVSAQMEAIKMESRHLSQRHAEQMSGKSKEIEALRDENRVQKEKMKREVETLKEEIVSLKSELRTVKESTSSVREEEVQKLCEASKEAEVLRLRLKELTASGVKSVTERDEQIRELEEKLLMGETLRRKMHNTIQELRGNVRVFARVRPFLPSDQDSSANAAIDCHADGEQLQLCHPTATKNGSPYTFKFDKAFAPSSGQDTVFQEVSEFVQSALDGYQVCLFSYGQTGSGKTHTMQGSGHGQMRGIIPRAIEKVLSQTEVLKEQGWVYYLEVSFLEIYNETVRDLLASPSSESAASSNGTASLNASTNGTTNGASNGTSNEKKHMIKKDPNGSSEHSVYVTDLTSIPVDKMEQVESIMERAARQRSVGATDMNAQSSRSHSVFTLSIKGTNESQGTVLSGKLNLVDLAGSERLSRSGATGSRLKETQAINKSLSSLTDVFAALANKSSHIPFRNSKLTYLLQPCLSGDGKTLMMVNLSPTESSYHESLCSLRFAKQVNQCELGKPKRQVKLQSGRSAQRTGK